jgi:hypothetical protein
MTTFKAIIFLLKSLVDLGLYITKTIKREQYLERLEVMDDYIYKASNGELGSRLKAGSQIEDQINSHAGRDT